MIKALFIEDDQDNIESYTQRFKMRDIELISVDSFPSTALEFWKIVVERDVDFIIIDNHLHKKSVQYNGMDVLTEIRKEDSEIFILYLTSKGFDQSKLSEFDQAVYKDEFDAQFELLIKRINRAISRDLSYKMEREIDVVANEQLKFYEERITLIKNKLG